MLHYTVCSFILKYSYWIVFQFGTVKMLKTYKDPSSTSALVIFVPSALCKLSPKLDTKLPTTVGTQRLRTNQT